MSVEVLFNGKRTILPHAATFYGRPLTIRVRVEPQKEEFDIESHTNESVGVVKVKQSVLCFNMSRIRIITKVRVRIRVGSIHLMIYEE